MARLYLSLHFWLCCCCLVCLQIQKFGDPNGIVQFAPESLFERNFTEPSAVEGPQNITLFLRRVQGTLGNITVFSLLFLFLISGVIWNHWCEHIQDRENIFFFCYFQLFVAPIHFCNVAFQTEWSKGFSLIACSLESHIQSPHL